MESVSTFMYKFNTLTKLYSSPSSGLFQYTAGTEVYNTGQNAERINNNSYAGGLLIGNDGCYTCANTATGIPGLRYVCNTNDDNVNFDFIFQGDPRISKIQHGGAANVAAGNTFSNNATVSHWHHVSGINSNAPVTYVYDTGNEPTLNILNVVTIQGNAPDCNSPNNFMIAKLDSSNYEELNAVELISLKTQYHTFDSSYNLYNTLYMQLIDDGNTEALVEEISSATIEEQLATRAYFLSLSPYVSQTALYALANQQIVSNPILLEILLANPDATRDESFMEFIENELPNPFAGFMIDLIRASWDGAQTARNLLEQNVSNDIHQLTELKNHIIRAYLINDTVRSEDSAFVWMQKLPSIRNSYEILEYQLYKGNTSIADSLLDSLTVRFKFSFRDSIEHLAFVNLYNFKKSLLEDTLEINQLDSTRIEQLQVIADDEAYTFARSMARSALCFFYQICYPDTVRELPSSSAKQIPIKKRPEKPREVHVYPNPARDFVTCYYNFKDKANEAKMFKVSDITGKQIYQTILKGAQGQHIWNTQNIGNGNYIYTLITESGEKYSGKVTIQK